MARFYLFLFALAITTTSCGYRATTYYTQKLVGKSVYTDININIVNPETTVALKDSLNEIVLNKFNSNLVPKSKADTQMIASLGSVRLSVLQYDDIGYVSMYRANVSVSLKIINQDITKSFSGSGYYDFAVSDGAISSKTQKLEAIKGASKSALDSIVSKIVYAGR